MISEGERGIHVKSFERCSSSCVRDGISGGVFGWRIRVVKNSRQVLGPECYRWAPWSAFSWFARNAMIWKPLLSFKHLLPLKCETYCIYLTSVTFCPSDFTYWIEGVWSPSKNPFYNSKAAIPGEPVISSSIEPAPWKSIISKFPDGSLCCRG